MPSYRPHNYSPLGHAAAAEQAASDRFALKCAGDDIADLCDKLAAELKGVEHDAVYAALEALEEHAARLRVAAENG